eukprot:COSAG04_NODE_24193_length_325_cov_1.146018_1_plen_56_part_10
MWKMDAARPPAVCIAASFSSTSPLFLTCAQQPRTPQRHGGSADDLRQESAMLKTSK